MGTIPWERAIVVGASSGIGAAVARQLVAGGCRVALVARRRALLEALAGELGVARALPFAHDVEQPDTVPATLDAIRARLGGVDLLVYAAGIMSHPRPDEWNQTVDAAIVRTNVIGAMAWINAVAPHLVAAGRGTIVGISSVAGDRGRRGYPAYHASKAALDTYLEAVRHRLAGTPIRVVTVKPGPVDTPMSRGLPRLPLLIPADTAAAATLRAARGGRLTVYVPRVWRPIMFVIRNLPGPIFRRLDI